MKHITIDYGIDLGTTNSAICRMEQGRPVIIRSDAGMETMPSCVLCRKGGDMSIGQSAYDNLGRDKLRALKKHAAAATGSFIEFKRYMGSDMTFDNAGHHWSPEELSAQVIRTLCSFVPDDRVNAAVITVPAKFTVNQKDATIEAARLAGIDQVELLQEPIAASMAYGLTAEEKNGIWMVFDFGGGTLDVALVNVRDGVMQVFDTEGDNYLGGKNLDEAVVAKIILPRLASRFSLDLADEENIRYLFDALKVEAEKVKNRLSYSESVTLYLEAGDWGEDEDGEEIELEMTIGRKEFEKAVQPVLQKAVDVCKTLMLRNDMDAGSLSHLILIGGPTCIPLLRRMLREQVTPNVETSINPMTAVATGAAIYASTIPVAVNDDDLDNSVVKLDIEFDATTVETRVYIPVRTGNEVEGLSVKLIRRADGMESDEVRIGGQGDIVEVDLLPGQPNVFRIQAMAGGVEVKCFPSELTIVQGTRAGSAILPYNIGIEVFNPKKSKYVFSALTGLEKNRPLPAVGVVYGLKTMSDLHPGNEKDCVRLAVYQGDDNAEGKTAALFEYVSNVVVSGEDIVSFIPKGSHLNVKIEVDRSEMMNIVAEFPESGQRVEKRLDTSVRQGIRDTDWLKCQISQAREKLADLQDVIANTEVIGTYLERLSEIDGALEGGAQHKQVEQHLKEVLRDVEDYETGTEWEREFYRLKKEMLNLQVEASTKGDPGIARITKAYEEQVDKVKAYKDVLGARTLRAEIKSVCYRITQDRIYRNFILWADEEFSALEWTDPDLAGKLVSKAMKILKDDPEAPLSKTREIAENINGLLVRADDNENGITHRVDLPSM